MFNPKEKIAQMVVPHKCFSGLVLIVFPEQTESRQSYPCYRLAVNPHLRQAHRPRPLARRTTTRNACLDASLKQSVDRRNSANLSSLQPEEML